MDGLDVCRHIRLNPRTARLPVIVVTARSTEADRVLALEAGADDIVTAPFSLRELTARIHAVLRRARPAAATPTFIDLGDLTVDLIRYEVRFRGKPIFLTATEFRVLQTLALRAGKIVTRSELTAARRGRALADDPGLDVHVASIRKKLKAGRDLIRIIHGFGFRLDAQGVPGQTGIEPYITEPEQPPIPIVDQRRTG
jgi:DNA-binding response OmpR family regulator